ncbi:hypothetical protein M2G70_21995 [Vibrio vulnificus]|nr:hypothetical protein [Vibrio vulnificus]
MVTALCGSFCIACLRPLTRRYMLGKTCKEVGVSFWIKSHFSQN